MAHGRDSVIVIKSELGRMVGGADTVIRRRPSTRSTDRRASGASSIPSKYQTVVVNGGERRGFGGSASRFADPPREVPGPGAYFRPTDLTITKDSISRRGMGNGFVSRANRFEKEIMPEGASPAAYDPRPPRLHEDFCRAPATVGFHPPLARPRTAPQVPAPNSYNVLESEHAVRPEKAVTAAFRSGAKRSAAFQDDINTQAPPPNLYTPHVPTHDPVPYASAFKSHSERIGVTNFMASGPEVPGPGAYDLLQSPPRHEPPHSRLRSQQVAPQVIPVPAPPTPPGPAHYSTAPEPVQRRYISSSMFLSRTRRDELQLRHTDAPGPARYRPRLPSKHTSFNYNQAGTWV